MVIEKEGHSPNTLLSGDHRLLHIQPNGRVIISRHEIKKGEKFSPFFYNLTDLPNSGVSKNFSPLICVINLTR